MNTGYLGYMSLGYSQREVDMFVWLEVLRDKQCDDKPCELGVLVHGKKDPRGGCPDKWPSSRFPLKGRIGMTELGLWFLSAPLFLFHPPPGE